MSFGWGAGDIVAACQLIWSLVKALDDVSGAPEHYRETANSLRVIRYRFECLQRFVEGEAEPNGTDDIKDMIASLKTAYEQLEELVNKGSGIGAGPKHEAESSNRLKQQYLKLQWFYGREEKVDNLIKHIHDASAFITDLYQTQQRKINDRRHSLLTTELKNIRRQAIGGDITTSQRYDTIIKLLWRILENTAADGNTSGLEMGPGETETVQPPLKIHVGPELGIPLEQAANRLMTLLQKADVTYQLMADDRKTYNSRLFVDNRFIQKVRCWLTDGKKPVLWLHGGDGLRGTPGANASLVIYTVMSGQKKPTIAFVAQHTVPGRVLKPEERLLSMLYSLLLQVLHLLQKASIDPIPEDEGTLPAGFLWSRDSIPTALVNLKYYLGLLPKCICFVDGWNHVAHPELSPEDTSIVHSFLDIFARNTTQPTPSSSTNAGAEPEANNSGLRLLLTSRGNVPMMQGQEIPKDKVDDFDVGHHISDTAGTASKKRLDTVLRDIEW